MAISNENTSLWIPTEMNNERSGSNLSPNLQTDLYRSGLDSPEPRLSKMDLSERPVVKVEVISESAESSPFGSRERRPTIQLNLKDILSLPFQPDHKISNRNQTPKNMNSDAQSEIHIQSPKN